MVQKIKQDKDIIIGKNIRLLRLNKDKTQDDMVRELQLLGVSISRGTYSKIEMGVRHISASELEYIRDILGTTYEELLKHT